MRYTWLFILPPLLIIGIIIVVFLRYHTRSQDRDLKHVAVLAHTHTIKMLPAYRRAIKRYRVLLALAAGSFLISIFAFTATAARPISGKMHDGENANRDVILCIDMSGSMSKYIEQILRNFSQYINGLKGQRIGVTIFDGVPANLIPLSDDYDAVLSLINDLNGNFENYHFISANNGTVSAVGEGVMGCINSFDKLEDNSRSKSAIIVTDNEQLGGSIDINQAARYAKRYGITFYGLSINSFSKSDSELLFQNAITLTGGTFYNIHSNAAGEAAVTDAIRKVLEQDAAKIDSTPELIYTDNPAIALFVSGISFAAFLTVIWRLRL